MAMGELGLAALAEAFKKVKNISFIVLLSEKSFVS
jgi:hypothetical protein